MLLQARFKWGVAIGVSLLVGFETRAPGSTRRGVRGNSGDRDTECGSWRRLPILELRRLR